MQRKREKTLHSVTSSPLPVLIPVGAKEAEGFYVDIEGGTSRAQHVRRLTRKELVASEVAEKLTAEQWRVLRGLASLKIALAKRDALAIEKSLSLCFGQPISTTETPAEVAARIMSQPGAEPGTSFPLVQGLATGFLSDVLRKVRVVFWSSGMQMGPAIYCPDFKTAVTVRLILRDIFRICPRCQKTFMVEHPTQMCCSIECREAHRIARWRAAKRQEKSQ